MIQDWIVPTDRQIPSMFHRTCASYADSGTATALQGRSAGGQIVASNSWTNSWKLVETAISIPEYYRYITYKP